MEIEVVDIANSGGIDEGYFNNLSLTYNSIEDKKVQKAIDSAADSAARFVMQRYYAMSYAKQPIRQIWQGTQDLYYCNDWEWIVAGESFSRPVRFPTLRDFTKSLTDNFVKDPPSVDLQPLKQEDEQLIKGKKAYINQIKNSAREKVIARQIYEDTFFFGCAFRRVVYAKRVSGGTTLFDDLASQRIDPRDMFIDENALKLNDKLGYGARDIIIRSNIPYSTFVKNLKDKPGFNIDAVNAQNWFTQEGLDYWTTNTREMQEKTSVNCVKMYEYENPDEDLYIVVAGKKCIFKGSLKAAKGVTRFDVSMYSFEPRNDSVWPNNLAQLLAPHIYLKDTVLNLEVKNLELTLQPVIVASGEFGYNPRTHVLQPGGVWTAGGQMNGKLSDNIQTLIAGNPNTKSYQMLEKLDQEMGTTARTDLRVLDAPSGTTATEVLRQNQVSNSHNQTIAVANEIEAESDLTEIMLQIMESYLEEKLEDGNRRIVYVKGMIPLKTDSQRPEFIQKSGHEGLFELTESMINVQCKVKCEDKRDQVAQNLEKMGRMMQALPIIGNFIQLFPDQLSRIDAPGMIEQIAEAIGLDMDRTLKNESGAFDDEYEMLKEEIILGNKVDLPPNETRKESMTRLTFLLELNKEIEPKGSSLLAYNYHLDATIANITKNQMMIKQQQEAQQGQPQQPPPAPNAQQNEQAQRVQNQNQKKQQIGQPDPALLNTAGAPANQLT